MKTKFVFLLLVMATFTLTSEVNAQKFQGLDKSPHDIAYYKTSRGAAPAVKVLYGRPQLKGRKMSTLAPNGKIWRTGANEASEITFYKDVKFGGKSVKAGTYTLFTIPGEKEWTVILNKELNVWGAFSYKEANDAARVKVPVGSNQESIEAFSIAFKAVNKGAHLVLAWGKVRIEVPVTM